MRAPWLRVRIDGPSMLPTLAPGEWWLARRTKAVKAGDLVVFIHPRHGDLTLVKRVIRWDQAGCWVEGDNANASEDSRQFGAIPADRIIGRLSWRYFPWSPREARAILRNNRG